MALCSASTTPSTGRSLVSARSRATSSSRRGRRWTTRRSASTSSTSSSRTSVVVCSGAVLPRTSSRSTCSTPMTRRVFRRSSSCTSTKTHRWARRASIPSSGPTPTVPPPTSPTRSRASRPSTAPRWTRPSPSSSSCRTAQRGRCLWRSSPCPPAVGLTTKAAKPRPRSRAPSSWSCR